MGDCTKMLKIRCRQTHCFVIVRCPVMYCNLLFNLRSQATSNLALFIFSNILFQPFVVLLPLCYYCYVSVPSGNLLYSLSGTNMHRKKIYVFQMERNNWLNSYKVITSSYFSFERLIKCLHHPLLIWLKIPRAGSGQSALIEVDFILIVQLYVKIATVTPGQDPSTYTERYSAPQLFIL